MILYILLPMLGVYMIGRDLGQQYEIAMVTLWDSWESIENFAGDPVDRAKYYDRDLDFLIDPPEKVEHFDVLATENAGPESDQSILRLWKAPVVPSRKGEAIRREVEIGIPSYRRIDGNTRILVIGRELDERYEIGMLTLWDSWESLRAFAGDPPDRADPHAFFGRRCRHSGLDPFPPGLPRFFTPDGSASSGPCRLE